MGICSKTYSSGRVTRHMGAFTQLEDRREPYKT